MPSRLPGAAFASDLLAIFPQPGGDNLWCESLQKNLGAYACKQKDVCRTGNAAAAKAARGANRRVSDADGPSIVRNFALAKPRRSGGPSAPGIPPGHAPQPQGNASSRDFSTLCA
ncbi:hypothetical protein DA2_1724 [Desulfovibrio sp. A2]|nr:hypothetical protein DA2_1724 [Desulfovibrio sp. A2]